MTETEFVERCEKMYADNFESYKNEAIEIACKYSFYDALEFLSEQIFCVNGEMFAEAFLKIDPLTVRKLMYKRLLEKPCINWLRVFVELEVNIWKGDNINPYQMISYEIYKNYSKEEIIERLSNGLFDVFFECESFPLVNEKLAHILHASELVPIWKNLITNYINAIYCENDALEFISQAEKIAEGTVGYYVVRDIINQLYGKFIPYVDSISSDSSIGNLIVQKVNNKKDEPN